MKSLIIIIAMTLTTITSMAADCDRVCEVSNKIQTQEDAKMAEFNAWAEADDKAQAEIKELQKTPLTSAQKKAQEEYSKSAERATWPQYSGSFDSGFHNTYVSHTNPFRF